MFDLVAKYLDKGYQLFFDNVYTSLGLLKDLLIRKTFACGTVRVNRGEFPSSFKTAKLKPGTSLYIKNENNILAVHWKDKRDVFVMSSFHGNSESKIIRHRGEIIKPDVISHYNKNMGGVAKYDQYLSYYTVGKKTMKWWKKVFFHLLEMCIIKSMCIYFEKNPEFAKKPSAHKIFREVLVHQLVQPYLDKRSETETTVEKRQPAPKKARRVATDDSVRLSGKHYPTKKYPRRKCCYCAYKIVAHTGQRKNTRTNYYCVKCNKYICRLCFASFHTNSRL